MKFLAFIFLFGLASASLLEIYPNSDEEDFLLKTEEHNKKDELQTELVKKLKETLVHILKQIKKTIEEGKDVSKELLDQAEDLVRKLKSYGEDVGDEARDLFNYIKTRIQRWVEELLRILREKNTAVHRADDKVKTEIGKKLRDFFDHIVNRVKESVEEGKHVSEEFLDKAKQVLQRLKDYGGHISNDTKNLLEELKSKYNEWAQQLLDIIHGKTSVQKAEGDLKTEFGRKLKAAFERIVKRINETLEEGRHVSKKLVDQAKHLARKLKEYGVEVSDEIKDLFNYWKERAHRWIDELLDIIRGDNSTVYYSEPEVKTELAKALREKFEHIVRHIKKLIQEGKHVSEKLWEEARDLGRKLREYGLNVKDEIVDILEYIKERYYRWVDELIDIIRGKKEAL